MTKHYSQKLKGLFLPISLSLFTILNILQASAQKFGIGTTSPTVECDVESNVATASGGTALGIEANHGTDGNPEVQLKIRGTTKFSFGIDDSDDDKFKFGTSSLETGNLFVIDKTNTRFGFGLAGPANKFNLVGTSTTQDEFIIENTSTGDPCLYFQTNATVRLAMGIDNSTANDEFLIGSTSIGTNRFLRYENGKVQFGDCSTVPANLPDFSFGTTTSATEGSSILLYRDDATTANQEDLGFISFGSDDGAAPTDAYLASCAILSEASQDHTSLDKGARFFFYVSPNGRDDNVNNTSAMQIDANGRISIGAAGIPSHLLHIAGEGRATNAAWNIASDQRVKENIKNLENGIETIMKFRPVTYDWIDEYRKYNTALPKSDIGFIAQECEAIIPVMVTKVEEKFGDHVITDFNVLNAGTLTPFMVKAYQEQYVIIKNQQKAIKELKEKRNELVARMERLEKELNKPSHLSASIAK